MRKVLDNHHFYFSLKDIQTVSLPYGTDRRNYYWGREITDLRSICGVLAVLWLKCGHEAQLCRYFGSIVWCVWMFESRQFGNRAIPNNTSWRWFANCVVPLSQNFGLTLKNSNFTTKWSYLKDKSGKSKVVYRNVFFFTIPYTSS